MTSSQAGKKAGVTMTSFTGYSCILHLLLLGILLPSVLVSGQSSTKPTASSSMSPSSSSIGASSSKLSTAMTARTTPTKSTMVTTNSRATSTSRGQTTSTNQPPTSPTSPTSAASKMTMAQTSPTTMASGGTSASNSMTSGSGFTNSMMSSTQPTGMSGMSGTSMYPSMGMISCPSFACNYSDCYSMYMSQNTTSCAPGACCELIRQTSMYYTAGCSNSCSDPCVNVSQTNCSVSCCNSTGCLNSSFASMMMTNTAAMTTTKKTTTTPMATTTTASPQTTAKKEKKCHQGLCTGDICYNNFKTIQTCTSSQAHCELKKETDGNTFKWTAGCTTNCSSQTLCKTATKPPCHLQCCKATKTSCLRLNSVQNVATRGPHLNTELIVSFLCLLALTLLR